MCDIPDKHAITHTGAISNKGVSPVIFCLGKDTVPAKGPVYLTMLLYPQKLFQLEMLIHLMYEAILANVLIKVTCR